MKYLYKLESKEAKGVEKDKLDIEVKVFTPSIRGLQLHGENFRLKTVCV